MPGGRVEMPLVIGLTGPLGSGVSTTSNVLAERGFHRISIADAIRTEYRRKQGLPDDAPLARTPEIRNALQDLGNEMRLSESVGYWAQKAVEGTPQGTDLVIDGIRNLGEVQWLRNSHPRFFLVAVVAPKDSRWKRIRQAYGGREADFDWHDKRDSEEDIPTGQQVQKCVLDSDYVFTNDETEHNIPQVWAEKVWSKFEAAVKLMKDGHGRAATADEVFMAMAYAQSHASACLKRHVGAVIVDVNRQSLSSGYNENPLDMLPCVHQFKYCYKDVDMEQKLIAMSDVFCVFCGHKNERLDKTGKCIGCGGSLKSELFRSRNMELCTAIHAEERSIRGLQGRSAEGATMYVTTFPCFQCARYIIDAKIAKVVYVEPYPVPESARFLEMNKIFCVPFEGFKARAFNLIFKQVE
jgi:deoxycytidylate deaminase